MATISQGWFIDPDDPTQERWWYGRSWSPQTRPLEEGTPAFPGKATAAPPSSSASATKAVPTSSGLSTAGGWMYAIAALTALGGIIGGIVLIAHGVPHCVANPYDDTIVDCSSKHHPYAASGVALIIGSLLQTAVIAVVGRLCFAVAAMRAERTST